MKKRKWLWRVIILVILLVAVVLLTHYVIIPLFDTSGEGLGEEVTVYGYTETDEEFVLENDELRFELDPATTHFTVTDKASGQEWHSSPPDAESDPIALPVEKNRLQSNVTVTYSANTGMRTLFSSNEYSVQNGVYQVTREGDAIRVDYSLGKISRTFYIPEAITEERFNQFVDQMPSKAQKNVKEYYQKKDINKLRKTDNDNKEELLAKYPELENSILYILRDTVKDHLKGEIEGYFAEVGYTQEEWEYDMANVNSGGTTASAVFNVTLRYSLSGNDLLVEMPMSEIGYYADYPITNIAVLPAFGAGGTDETGFMLVPDGAGGIINFNNGKTTQNAYFANLYGWDWASIRTQVTNETRIDYGVFGVSKGDASFLCFLEDGSSWAGISADISGRNGSYNTINASYTIVHGDAYDVSDRTNNAVYMFEQQLPDVSIVQRYRFLQAGDYVSMGKAYGQYLTERYPELADRRTDGMPVVVEALGAIDKVQQRFGVPTNLPVKLSSYSQAQAMLADLLENGMENVSFKLSGWMNGGLNQRVLNKVSLIGELGGAKELEALTAYAKEKGVPLYLDGLTQFGRDSGIAQGFLAIRDAAKFTTREEAEIPEYSSIWYGDPDWRDTFYLLRPSLMVNGAKVLQDAAGKYDAAGVSFRDIGYMLSADYDAKALVTREESKAMQADALKNAQASGMKTMIRHGNDYALPYADIVTDTDFDSVGYGIVDQYVPFWPIAVHGKVAYTGTSLNNEPDFEEELLRSAEMGAGLYFTVFAEDAESIRESWFTEYFGSNFDFARDRILSTYQDYAGKLGGTFSQAMVDHVRDGNVSVTTYEDGTKVYVNFGYSDIETDGVAVPARSFAVKEGAQ